MGEYTDTGFLKEREIVRKKLDVFLLIDTSGEISIDAVEEIRNQLRDHLAQEQTRQGNLDICISEVIFSETVGWTAENCPILEYVPNPLTIHGRADYTALFRSLNKRMSRKDLLAHEGRRAIPWVFFITDGKPAGELQDRNMALEELKNNGWFHNAFRYVLLIGDSCYDPAAREAVKDFVKRPEEGILAGMELESVFRTVRM